MRWVLEGGKQQKMGDKQRSYNCPECGKPLTEGLEYQFPPRLSYWCCQDGQQIFKETDKGGIVAYVQIAGDGRLCKQDDSIRGYVMDMRTREITYPDDLPALEVG